MNSANRYHWQRDRGRSFIIHKLPPSIDLLRKNWMRPHVICPRQNLARVPRGQSEGAAWKTRGTLYKDLSMQLSGFFYFYFLFLMVWVHTLHGCIEASCALVCVLVLFSSLVGVSFTWMYQCNMRNFFFLIVHEFIDATFVIFVDGSVAICSSPASETRVFPVQGFIDLT